MSALTLLIVRLACLATLLTRTTTASFVGIPVRFAVGRPTALSAKFPST